MSEASIRALLGRWETGVSNLYAANEEEGHAPAAVMRAARAATYECCIHELREALAAPHAPADGPTAVTAGAETHGEAGEAQEGSRG